MQYTEMAEERGWPLYCSSCESHWRCFEKEKTLTLRAANKKPLENVTKENVLEKLEKEADLPAGVGLLSRCTIFSLCPMSVIDDDAFQLLSLYNQLGGTSRISTIEQLNSQPEIYLRACNIIESEKYRASLARESNRKEQR